MTRLTIIIPFSSRSGASGTSDRAERLEETLVSVLEHRSPACDVVVSHDGSYEDPYDLGDEVQFIVDRMAHTNAQLLNTALNTCDTAIAHVLMPGTTVHDGWTQGIASRFKDSSVATVSPLIVDSKNPNSIVALGVGYGCGGARMLIGAGRTACENSTRRVAVMGPSLIGGFYRIESVQRAGGFDSSVGDELADIDLALSLSALGYRCEFSDECCLSAEPELTETHGFKRGQGEERLFWRHIGQRGIVRSLLMHPITVLSQSIGDVPHPDSMLQLVGRTLALTEMSSYREYASYIAARILDQQSTSESSSVPDTISIVAHSSARTDSTAQTDKRKAA